MLGIGVRSSRYSYELIKETGGSVVNLPTSAMVVPTDFCGVRSGRDVDKFEATGFTRARAEVVAAPLIAECPICIECVVRQSHLLGTHDYIIGEVVAVHVDESLAGTSWSTGLALRCHLARPSERTGSPRDCQGSSSHRSAQCLAYA